MSKCLVTMGRKISLLTGRKLQHNQAQGGNQVKETVEESQTSILTNGSQTQSEVK